MAHYYYKIKDKIKHNNKDIICCNLGYYEFNYKKYNDYMLNEFIDKVEEE